MKVENNIETIIRTVLALKEIDEEQAKIILATAEGMILMTKLNSSKDKKII